jgi:hypothetical protein
LRRIEEIGSTKDVSPYHLAYIYTGLGEYETAIDLLQRACDERSGNVFGVKGSFLFSPLHSHPRFQALLRSMHLE